MIFFSYVSLPSAPVTARNAADRRSLRAVVAAFLPGAVATFLVAGAFSSASALTLHHTYTFDPATVALRQGPAGNRVEARTLPTLWEAGQPELPYDVVTLLVPQGSRLTAVRARAADEVVVADHARLGVAGPIVNDAGVWRDPEPARLAAAALTAKAGASQLQGAGFDAARYPAVCVEPCGSGALHGYQMVSVRVFPLRYAAGTGKLFAARRLDIDIDLAPGGALPLGRERYSAAIEARARRTLQDLVANSADVDGYARRLGQRVDKTAGAGDGFHPAEGPALEGSAVDYVIVTSASLAPAWQVLADWKTRRGVPTVVRTIDWIESHYRRGSDTQETIRTFIKDAYTKWGVQYVLLAGDTDVIPARYAFSGFGEPSEQNIPTDMYFACLDGNWNNDGDGLFGEAAVNLSNPGDSTDLYAEVFVGRLPVSTPAEAAALVSKVTTYENPPNTTYQRQLLLLGEVLFPVDWSTGQPITLDGAAYSEELLDFTGPCLDTLRLYQNWQDFPGSEPLTRERALAEMSAGKGFVNHVGHGYRYNMSLGDVSMTNNDALALTNGDKRFVLYMLNCTAGAFDFPCLSEAFLKSNGGAVAVLGSTRSAYAVPAHNYNREFFEALHADGFVHLGEAFVHSRLQYTPNAYFDTSDHYSHFLYNYLGDPEMVVHTCSLATTAATLPSSIGLGTTNVALHVTAGGDPAVNALVCLMKGTGGAEAYETGFTDAGGDLTLPFRAESGGTVQVTISGHNQTTLQSTIAVTPQGSPYVHVSSLGLDDSDPGPSNGNGDGVLDAGETIELDVTGINDGPVAASGVTGVLRIPGPWATVTDSTFALGAVGGNGGTASALQDLVFGVAANTPDGTVLDLKLEMTDGAESWHDVVKRVVHAPVLRLTLLDVDDPSPGGNNNGTIQAGETFDLLAYFKNYGTGAANGLLATIASTNPDVTILEDSVGVGNLASLQEATGATRFRLSEAVLAENAIDLTLTDSHGRTSLWPITLRGPVKPAKPVLSTKAGAGLVIATWTPSVETDLAGYHIYRSLALAGPWTRISADRTLDTAYYRDSGLAPSTLYYYYVTAVDLSGNESIPSDIANINTNPPQLVGWPIQLGASSSCPVAVGDITGDGSKEIIAGNDHLYAWNWNGLEVRDDDNDPLTWGIFSREVRTVTGAVALGELDGQPGEDVFVTSWDDTNKAYAVRGNGDFLAGWLQNPDPGTPTFQRGYWASSAAVDVDADGRAELFGPAKNGNLYAWHYDGTPLGVSAAFKTGLGSLQKTSPSFANLDADPELEIIFGAANGQLFIWNIDGSNFPNFPVAPGASCFSNTAVGDVNHDGVLDVVMLTEGGLVNVYNTATGTQLPGWPRSLLLKGNPVTPSPALADFDFDGFLEIVVANSYSNTPSLSRVQVFDYQGNIRPGWPKAVGNSTSESSPIVADFSGDGVPDILFGNEGGALYGWDANGNDLPGFPITIGDFVRSTPFADDVDGDGYLDLVLSGWDKNVYIFDFPAAWSAAAAQWPTLKHDAHRSGTFGFVFDIAPPSPPTTLASTSHTPSAWSNDPTIDVAWSGASDPSGIGGYSVVWDTSPSTLPDQTIDTVAPNSTSPPCAEGQSHWFHIRTADALGHWTAGALHLGPFWIDVTPPGGVPSVTPDRSLATWANDNTVEMTWLAATDPGTAPAAPSAAVRKAGPRGADGRIDVAGPIRPGVAGSGMGGYSVLWSTNASDLPDATIETTDLTTTSPALADGQAHWFHIRPVDAAGNGADAASTLHSGPFWIDATPPAAVVLAPNGGEVWAHQSVQTIRWRASDATSGVASVAIDYSTNGGATYPHHIADPPPQDSTYAWTVPLDLTSTARIRVRVVDATSNATADASDANFAITTATDVATAPPVTRTGLEPAAPNPFNPATTLRYSLLESGSVHLVIYDARGRVVRTLVEGVQDGPHWYEARWNGRSDAGQSVSSGVYFVRLTAAGRSFVERVTLTK